MEIHFHINRICLTEYKKFFIFNIMDEYEEVKKDGRRSNK